MESLFHKTIITILTKSITGLNLKSCKCHEKPINAVKTARKK
jgi:hypothetical protein